MKITWNKNIESEHKAEIEKYLVPMLWLTPQWCQNIHVNLFDACPDNSVAAITVDYAYRFLSLDIYTSWLNQSAEEKQIQIIHELCHSFLCVIANYARDSFDLLCPTDEAEKFNKHLQNELRTRHESITQDLAKAIYDKFK